MSDELEITVVVENSVYRKNLLAEHGLAFLINYRGEKYLFDTGQGKVLIHNLANLDIKIKDLAGVFISHGHYDHLGGLSKLLEKNPGLKVYAHPNIFHPKYSQKRSGTKFRGTQIKKEDIKNFKSITNLTEIRNGLYLSGEITMNNRFEQLNKSYQVKVNNQLQFDRFEDDQSLIIDTKQGLVVLLGCSHRGVINILDHIQQNFPTDIDAIIGGMHLINASEEKINATINQLKEIDCRLLVPLHCTGRKIVKRLSNIFKDKVKLKSVGDRIEFTNQN